MEHETIVTMILVVLLILVVGGIALAFMPEQFEKVFGFAKDIFGIGKNKTKETYSFVEDSKDILTLCQEKGEVDCMCHGKYSGLPEGYFIAIKNHAQGVDITAFSEDNVPIGKGQRFHGYKIGVAILAYNNRNSIMEGMESGYYADGVCLFKNNLVIQGDSKGRASIKIGDEHGEFYSEEEVVDIMKISDTEYCFVTRNIEQEDFAKLEEEQRRTLPRLKDEQKYGIYILNKSIDDYKVLYKLEDGLSAPEGKKCKTGALVGVGDKEFECLEYETGKLNRKLEFEDITSVFKSLFNRLPECSFKEAT